jgi:DNA-binding NtrC family response regulator
MIKKRILFVDDDAELLAGLKSVLRRERERWDMVFANGPDAALAALSTDHFDAIVSDMRMPGMDGGALLDHVHDHHPEMVRIILSGSTDHAEVARATAACDEMLEKPCPAKQLRATLERWFAREQKA